MKYPKSIEEFFARDSNYKKEIRQLRAICQSTELEEKLKWGMPVYCINNKNVVGINAFKNHFALWFYQGVFLRDELKILTNAQEGKTKAMRHWKMTSAKDIKKRQILAYIKEAIANQKAGKVVKAAKPKAKSVKPTGLIKTALESNKKLKASFEKLTSSKQNEYVDYIVSAKQEKTKLSRLEKIKPMIMKGVGLSELWKR